MKNHNLELLCKMLNSTATCSFMLKNVKVMKAERKIGLIGVRLVSGFIRVELDGKTTDYEIVCDDLKIIDGESKEIE